MKIHKKLAIVISCICICLTGCNSNTSNKSNIDTTITDNDSSTEENDLNNGEYSQVTWLESFDWNSLDKFDAPKDFSISDIPYPLNFDTLLSNNFCVLNISSDEPIDIDGKNYYTISDFKDIVGKENSYVPTYYLGRYFDRDEKRESVDMSTSCYAKDGELKTVQTIGTLVYTNGDTISNDNLIFNGNSKYSISIQYPMSLPTIILPTGLNYTVDDGYYSYDGQDWIESLIKNNLGKPTKIYGMYTDVKDPITRDDGKKISNNFITWNDHIGYEAMYKLVWEYNSSCIVLEVKEFYNIDKNTSVTKYSHKFNCYSIELYSSTDAFNTMATYLDKNCIDITTDMLK